MKVNNPFGAFREECEAALRAVILRGHPDFQLPRFLFAIPSSSRFGDLSSTVCFEISKQYGGNPKALAESLVEEISGRRFKLVEKVEALNGYLNFSVDLSRIGKLTVEASGRLGGRYGLVKAGRRMRVIVEHTSANPSGPLHAGTARNAILGDSLSRLLQGAGHNVRRHFYVDDVGKQVAMVVYGFKILGEPKIEGKPDGWIGLIYTATNCAITIRALREEVEALMGEVGDAEKLERRSRLLDEYMALAVEMKSRLGERFYRLTDGVEGDPDPEGSVEGIMRLYEGGDLATRRVVRRMVKACLRGFRETLRKAGIGFDSWDWESDLVWSGAVKTAVKRLRASPYVYESEGALTFNVDMAAEGLGVKDRLFRSLRGAEVPPLVLVRSDGTTLYSTRDVAYHLEKFRWAERAVNVIGVDQILAQLQLKVALMVLGLSQALDGLVHCSYELVNLPGYKMSRRRGRYVTFDEILEGAVGMAYREVEKRAPEMAEGQKRRIARAVGLGAVKYAMLSVSAVKTVNFTWDRVINFEMNSGPFVQYAHARACSILRKAGGKAGRPDYGLLVHPLERGLVLRLSRFPEVFAEAAGSLKPELLAEYANGTADAFNAFYNELPVLKAENAGLRAARLGLVKTTRTVLSNALSLLGISAPTRM